MEKNNKNNKKLLVLGGMALLLTLIGVSGASTYAKYVTSTSVPTQQATVAKWGFVVTSNADNLFGEKHAKVADSAVTSIDSNGAVVVSANSGDNIVAPGTKGEMKFSIHGQAEVLSKITINLSKVVDVALNDGSKNVYNPVKWTLTENSTENSNVKVVDGKTLADVASYINTRYSTVAANTEINGDFVLSYEWAFTGVADSGLKNGETVVTGDQADTILGYKSNGTDLTGHATFDYAKAWTAVTNIGFDFSILVEQIQA